MNYCKLAKFITNQKINLIFAVVGLIDETRKWNKKNIDNYIEIYLKSDVKKIVNFNKKKIYHQKNVNNIVGVHIQPELPKKPDIIIENNFDRSINSLSNELIKKIIKII